MIFRKLFWRFYLSFLLIIVLSVFALAGYTSRYLFHFYLNEVSSQLETKAWILKDELQKRNLLKNPAEVDSLCKRLGEGAKSRFTVILASGKVIGDSLEEPVKMPDHSDRPEIKEALAGKTGKALRFSSTLQEKRFYLALPLEEEGKIKAVVRASVSVQSIQSALRSVYKQVFIGGIIIALVLALLSIGLSRSITKPLEELKKGANLFSQGELKHRIFVEGVEEVSELARTMNQMAEELDQRIKTIENQGSEIEAILSGMIEGVIALDMRGNILKINQAGLRMLGISQKQVRGRQIEELIRNPALQKFLRRILLEPGPIEETIALETDKYFQVRGKTISEARGEGLAAVVVLNDISSLKRLEKIRKEFVANVSHELKTPITAIQGSAETLLSGAKDDKEAEDKFLKMIKNHSERLNAIIEDLLLLARIEQEEEKPIIKFEKVSLKPILESAVQAIRPLAEKRNMSLVLSCAEDLKATVNPEMLEQAVRNLLDNAIKYSEPGKIVRVSAEAREKQIVITVEDQGFGIAKEHLERIFERFYVVDKSRSRKLGGTGLGLAIVKHIAQAHQGEVSVESEPGKGSKFSIILPS